MVAIAVTHVARSPSAAFRPHGLPVASEPAANRLGRQHRGRSRRGRPGAMISCARPPRAERYRRIRPITPCCRNEAQGRRGVRPGRLNGGSLAASIRSLPSSVHRSTWSTAAPTAVQSSRRPWLAARSGRPRGIRVGRLPPRRAGRDVQPRVSRVRPPQRPSPLVRPSQPALRQTTPSSRAMSRRSGSSAEMILNHLDHQPGALRRVELPTFLFFEECPSPCGSTAGRLSRPDDPFRRVGCWIDPSRPQP